MAATLTGAPARPRKLLASRRTRVGILYALPVVVYLLVLFVYPIFSTLFLSLKNGDGSLTLHWYAEALTGDNGVTIGSIVKATNQPHLSIAPARIALAKLESKLVGELDAHFRLKEKLAPLEEEFPYMVIDCPPTLGLLTVNALVAASHLVVPIQSSYFALEGTDDLLETVGKVQLRANPSLQVLGVLITMHDKRTSLARDIRDQIKKVFGAKVFKTVITKSVRLEESPAYKEAIFSFAPESSGASEYYSVSEEVLSRV